TILVLMHAPSARKSKINSSRWGQQKAENRCHYAYGINLFGLYRLVQQVFKQTNQQKRTCCSRTPAELEQ
ncbi:MAG: hypothetical protein OSA44_07625, partial [Nitrospinaceae bacterium]|nr:hypothetical protein [Nitrospinaceae bacterium]